MEFLKSGKFINFLFSIFAIFAAISFMWTFFYHQNEFDIPLIGHVNADLRVNIEGKNLDKIHLMTGKIEISPYKMKTANSYLTYELNKIPIYNLSLKADGENPKEILKSIDNIVVFISSKMFYFSGDDILKFKETKDGKFLFPDDMKYSKTSKYMTDKGNLKHFTVCMLSVFYNMKYYIFPFCFFILAALIYSLNKDKIELGFNFFKESAIWFIILLALILRITDSSFPFWSDELYTATVAGNPEFPFSAVFSDPGNPPLFFILARFQQIIFGQNEALLRLLPCVFSILTTGMIYVFVKRNISKGPALFSAFLFAISLYSIHSAQEFRAYSLCALFSVVCAHCLFEIYKNPANKNFIIYAVIAVLMANAHYFQILILIGNFILGMFLFDNKSKLKFLYSNLAALLSFLPYFLMTALNKALLDQSFNALTKPDWNYITDVYSKFFTSGFVSLTILILAFILVVPKIKNVIFEKEDKIARVFLYSVYSTLFLFLSSFLISQIRPVIRQYYFVNVLPFIIISIALVIFLPFRNKIFKYCFGILFILFYFAAGNYINKDKTILVNFENVFKYAYFDSKKFNKKTGIALHDTEKYSLFYKKYLNGSEEFVMYPFLADVETMAEIILNSKADVIYVGLEHKTFPLFASYLSLFADVSMIRSDKDVLIARILKRTGG